MTHSIDAPFPPPVPATTGATAPSTSTGSPSTTDVAKDEARNVGQTAAQAGSQVASTAADQAKQVANETQRQARDLLDQGRTQVRQQVVSQQQKAGQSLSSLAQELRALADGSSQGAPGPARDLLQQASSSVESFASMLQNREPADLLDDVRSFARRKPGVFLLGAALAGVVAGRLTTGVVAAHKDQSNSGTTGSGGYVQPAAAPVPTYAEEGYAGTNYATDTTTTGYAAGTTGYSTTGTTGSVPPPPYGTVPPAGTTGGTTGGFDDPLRTGEVGRP